MQQLSKALKRWNEIIWETRLKLVARWVRLDKMTDGWLGVGERAYKGFIQHQGTANAAAIAYYVLFSLFPLTLLLISLGSFVLNSQEAQERALVVVAGYFPAAVELVRTNIERVLQLRRTASLVGIVGLIWAASGVFGGLSRAINRAWDVETPRPAWAERALAAGLVLLSAFLFFVSLYASPAIELVSHFSALVLSGSPVSPSLVANLSSIVLPFLLTALSFSFFYTVLPSTHVRWIEVLPGALLAGLAWQVAQIGFTIYLGTFASYNLVYGSVAAVIALLLWSYISGVIILLGAEFTVQYARRRRGE
ncbi:MAG: YihY family inner membrane protein [Anaerolineae bacterium]|nr:YihY family inner membrane protein [Anaerolineae bacterium]NIN97397.1 YihY family inner membrane protein [Anaerolineae bacterium]NIQ80326.1 YihY family inner membrane protein [Anaerolineae bacterium]